MKTIQKPQLTIALLFALLTVIWIVIRLQTQSMFLMDADGGHQLAGAAQILRGEHPFVDFKSSYGPLTFYASALAQLIFRQHFFGEMLLIIFGYAVAYVLLALLIHRITGKLWLSILFGVLALIAIPRFYKYYIVLGPVMSLWFIWKYIDRPKTSNEYLAALAITLTGLFRADFGVYCALAGTLAVLLQSKNSLADRMKHALYFGAKIVLFALPWLLFLAFNNSLLNYFSDMVIGGANVASGMSLPFPDFHAELPLFALQNLSFFVILFFFGVPPLGLLHLVRQWKQLPENKRIMLLTLVILSQFSLLQTYRMEIAHLLQSIPLSFVLLAWFADDLQNHIIASAQTKRPYQAGSGALVLLLICALASLPVFFIPRSRNPIDLKNLADKMQRYTQSNTEILANTRRSGNPWYVEMMKYIRRCTTDRQRLMALPAMATFFYFTDRSFGGGQIGVVSGYFVTDPDQNRIVRAMAAQDIPLIVYRPNFEFDGIPERKLEVVAPKVAAYIQKNYTRLKKIGPALLLLRNDLKVDKRAKNLVNMSCPHP